MRSAAGLSLLLIAAAVVLADVDPLREVRVKVRGPKGEALVGVLVQSGYVQGNGFGLTGGARTDENGDAILPHRKPPEAVQIGILDMPLVSFVALVNSKEFGLKAIEYRAGVQKNVEIRFEAPARLSVSVRGPGAKPARNALGVRLLRRGAGRAWTYWLNEPLTDPGEHPFRLDAAGRLEVGPIQPGSYRVEILSEGRFRTKWVVTGKDAEVKSGKNAVEIVVPKLHRLEVAFPPIGKAGGVSIRTAETHYGILQQYGEREFAQADAKGAAAFPDLPEGRYLVTDRRWGAIDDMLVTVPAKGPVTFAESKIDAVEVEITDPKGALATAGARTGDLVVAVMGEPIRSRTAYEVRISELAKLPAKRVEKVRLTLLNAGATRDIEVDSNALHYGTRLGARMHYRAK
jgi:hypothetical protein